VGLRIRRPGTSAAAPADNRTLRQLIERGLAVIK